MKVALSFPLLATCLLSLALPNVCGAPVSEEDRLEFARLGHPMFIPEHSDETSNREDEHERMLQKGCERRFVAVYESEYDVDYKDGDFQIGITPIYRPRDLKTAIGNWWWDWAVFRGTNYERSYGTMMIEYNPEESITFGFSVTQTNYPITGGYLKTTACPGGYASFNRQEGDVRYYNLYICSGC